MVLTPSLLLTQLFLNLPSPLALLIIINGAYKPSNLYNSSTEQIVTNTDFRPLPGTAGEIIAKTKCANGTSPCTNPVDNYTLSIGTRTTNTTPKGDYVSDTFVITAVTNKNVITCDSSKLCVQYDGNGLSYPETSSQLPRTVNNVNYNSTTTHIPMTKYSHTSNINDSGTASGTYPTRQATTDVVTIPNATELNITIYYATGLYGRYNQDATAYVFEGEYTGSISYNTTGYLKKYQDGTGTTKETANTETFTVSGDTVTFGFYSSTTVFNPAYGYYAIITGTGTAYERSVSSGEYATPTGTNPLFYGWSTTQTTPGGGLPSQVEYTDESEILAKMPGEEGETKTLYAVWQQGYPITFTMDSNVAKIDVLDSSGTTVGTITSSGQSLTLAQGDTYTIKPTHTTGYSTNAITKTSGAGTITSYGIKADFTVGAGAANINTTAKNMLPIQNFNCSTLANAGVMEYVYDTRDNEVYLIGKLADGKCWMLDNLRLDLTNSTILNGLTTSNTHVDSASLTSLKSGNRSAGARYASSGFVKWDSSSPDNVYDQAKANVDYKDTTTTSYGDGSGKIGVYYNYCAASAGNYCFGNGTSQGSPSGNATEDICPKGWRLPTGGSSGEYQALYTAYSSDQASLKNALSTPLSGYSVNGNATQRGMYGYFWSSTYSSVNQMYDLFVTNTTTILPSDDYYRNYGLSVRCLLGS